MQKRIGLTQNMGETEMNRQEAAETLALQALTWLAGNDELFPVFLGATGASVADLAADAGKPAFLVSVLDFVLTDDAMVTAFCDALSLPYDAPMQARMALPGGEQINWT
jgi:Protein of unknown function (DUF3572)